MSTGMGDGSATAATSAGTRSWLAFFRMFLHMAGSFWRGERRWRARGLSAVLVVLTVGQVLLAVALNLWIEQLFEALERRSFDHFLELLGALVLIIAANTVVITTHLRTKRRLQVDWREWLTSRLGAAWMTVGRQYQITLVPGDHDNPDGRIAEDIRIATEYAVDLAHSLFYSLVLLVSFAHILWRLSGPPEIAIGGLQLYIPGHLVWIAVVYAWGGTMIAVLLGRPLVRAANLRQAREADFRFGLAHARANALAIALLHGEGVERRRFGTLFAGVARAWERQTGALANLFLFTANWSVISQVFPILVVAPRYIAGTISLGALMQAAQAFQQMAAALSWPIDNFAKAAEWRASAERVHGLHLAIGEVVARVPPHPPALKDGVQDAAALRFVGFSVVWPDGGTLIQPFDAEIGHGERVLIAGETAATSNLIKAVAGLWPWSEGRVERPPGIRILSMPQRPYLPVGPLRDAICYPAAVTADDDAIVAALRQVGLDRLVDLLDHSDNWEQTLTTGEQQRIGFARLLLCCPDLVLMLEAIDALDAAGEAEMMLLLARALPETAVLAVSERAPGGAFYHRVFAAHRVSGGAVEITPAPHP